MTTMKLATNQLRQAVTSRRERERDAESASLTLTATTSAPRQARRFTTRMLQRWQAPPDVIESTEIIVSELVTNAYRVIDPDARHRGLPASRTAGLISLTLWRLPGQIVIGVTDRDNNPPLRSDAGADAESGRGLTLVQALSEQWGYQPLPGGGKVVYAILGIPQ